MLATALDCGERRTVEGWDRSQWDIGAYGATVASDTS